VLFFLYSYTRIVAYHLGTLDVQRVDVKHVLTETEPQDGEWWIHLEDGWMDPNVHDRRKMLAKRVSSN